MIILTEKEKKLVSTIFYSGGSPWLLKWMNRPLEKGEILIDDPLNSKMRDEHDKFMKEVVHG